MALTLESVNKGREAQGLPPIDKLATDTSSAANTEDKKEGQEGDKPTDTNTGDNLPELSDDRVLEFLKSKGITAASLEDLKPKAAPDANKTPEELAEERANRKLTYALENKLFNTKDHEGFITDSKNKETLVFADYVVEARKDDPTLTDEDLQAEFTEKYGLGEDVTSRKHKRGQSEIDMLADKILKNRYGKIYEADNKFSKYESDQASEKTMQAAIKEKSPAFIKDINDISEGIKKIPVKLSETETYDATIREESINSTRNHFLKPEVIKQYISEGYTKDAIKDIFFTTVLRMDYASMIEDISNQRMLKKQAGTRGIPAGGTAAKPNATSTANLTENQKKALAMYKPEPVAN